ncbi:MAG: type VI secretion system contractile sheath large subunit [Proteobacteria bacterium]|nr:type VI secretion system contractile sheath large subunit [Pseudomonadota bacterium]
MSVALQPGEPPTHARPALRVLVVADLGSGDAVLPPHVLRTPEDLAELLRLHRPRLRFEVPNLCGGQPSRLEVQLTLEAYEDLLPQRVVAAVEPLRRLAALARELEALAEGKAPFERLAALATAHADLDGLGALLRAAATPAAAPVAAPGMAPAAAPAPSPPAAAEAPASAPSSASSQDPAVDRILQLVRVPEAEERALAAVDRVVAQLTRRPPSSAEVAPARPALAAARARAIALLGHQLDAIVHHPRYAEVEASWRGLRFLVERTPFRAGIQLEVMHAAPADWVAALEQRQAALFEPDPGGVAPALIVAPGLGVTAPGRDAPAVGAERLQQAAELAEAAQVPLLASVGHTFFGLAAAGDAATLRYPGTLLEGVGYTKWNALRRKECARWLGVAFNPFLLRAPHEPLAADALPYREGVAQPAELLWGDPAWAVAALVVGSQGAGGWPTEIVGPARRLEDLPVHEVAVAGQPAFKLPLAARLPEALATDLVREGFIPLCGRSNRDSAFLPGAPTLFRPESEQAARATALAFPYQLLVCRIVKALDRYRVGRGAGQSAEGLRADLQRYLEGLVGATGYGWRVDLELLGASGPGDAPALGIALRVGSDVLGGRRVELSFGLPSLT